MKTNYLSQRIALILCVMFLSGVVTAQTTMLPNAGLESWDAGLTYDNPTGWESPNQILVTIPGNTTYVVFQENSVVQSGNHAVRLETKEIPIFGFPVTIPGFLTLGDLSLNMVTQEIDINGGIPFPFRPEYLTGYYNYIPAGNDQCFVEVVLLDFDEQTNTILDTIGSCIYNGTGTNGYVYFEVPINYYSTAQPNYLNINVISSDPANLQDGSVLYFDDIGFVGGDLFFSEYIEGSSYNKALEIYNPTNSTLYLDDYLIAGSTNGGGWQDYHNFPAGDSILPGDVWVIIADGVDSTLFNFAEADEIIPSAGVVHYNGDDARALCRITGQDTVIVDIFGDPDNDPGYGWQVAGINNATKDHTLIRKFTVEYGNSNWNFSAGSSAENSEWVVKPQNEFQYLGSHPHFVPVPPALRFPLVEYFTSYDTSCITCCNINQNFQDSLVAYSGDFAMITYPQNWPLNGDPYYIAESGDRFNFYSLSDIPDVRLNGIAGLNPASFDSTYFLNAMSDTSSIIINAGFFVVGQTIVIEAEISTLNNINIPGLKAHIAIVENQTFNNVSCANPNAAHYVLKKMLPGAAGTAIPTLSANSEISLFEMYTFGSNNTVEEFSDLSVVIFVQDENSTYVHQSAWADELPVVCLTPPYIQDFEGGALPAGWNQQSSASDGGWLYGDSTLSGSLLWNIPAHTNFVATNDDTCNCDKSSDRLISPCFDFSNEYSPSLSFEIFFNSASANGIHETATLDVSTDNGQNWITLDVLQGSTQWESLSYDLSAYSGVAPVLFSIHYSDNGEWLKGCAIDNFNIISPDTLDAELTEISTYEIQELGQHVVVKGVVANQGLLGIESIVVNWLVGTGAIHSHQFSGVYLQSGEVFEFIHPDTYLAQASGFYNLQVWISDVNSYPSDNNLQNNTLDKLIEVISVENNRLPLVEYFSSGNNTCTWCCEYEQSFQEIINSVGNHCSVIRYPSPFYSDGYDTPESTAKYNFYNVTGNPYLYLNGTFGTHPMNLTDTLIHDGYFFDTTSLTLSANSYVSGNQVDVEVLLLSSSAFTNPDMRLHIAIIENETYSNVNCQQVSSNTYVMKKMLPDENGTSINQLSSGTPYNFNYSYTFPISNTVEEFSDLSVVVFVQDSVSKYIYQSNWASMSFSATAPDWIYTNTGSSHSVLIQDTVSVTINGIQILPGDYIGVFYDSAGIQACGGYVEWTGQTIALAAWGDDSQSTAKDGFLTGEEFQWKIWRATDNLTVDAVATYIQPPVMPNTGLFSVNGISGIISLTANSLDVQNLILPQGWSYFSTYINALEPNIDSLFGPIISEVIIGKDGDGNTYWPQWGINTVGNVLIGEGYQIKLLSAQVLPVTGTSVPPESTPVVIDQGWGFLGYLRKYPALIETMLSPIISEVIIVKNGAGQIYWPQFGINTIGDMIPGEGYPIKMNSQQSLTYPAN